MKKRPKGSLINFPWYRDEQLSEEEAGKLVKKISREIERQDVLPIVLAILFILLIVIFFLMR